MLMDLQKQNTMASKFFDIPPHGNGLTKAKSKLAAGKYMSIPATSAPVMELMSV